MGKLLDDLSKRSRVHAVFLSRIEPTLLYVLSWVPNLFHSTTLHVSSSLSSSLCLPIQLMLLVRQDGSTWIPILIPSSTFLT